MRSLLPAQPGTRCREGAVVCAQLCTSGTGCASGNALPRALGRAPGAAALAHGAGKAWLEALERGWHQRRWSSGTPQPPHPLPRGSGISSDPTAGQPADPNKQKFQGSPLALVSPSGPRSPSQPPSAAIPAAGTPEWKEAHS